MARTVQARLPESHGTPAGLGPRFLLMDDPAEPQVPQPDSKGLFRLHRVTDPQVFRRVWDSEPYDFTPWLAENLDELGRALGMTLTLVGTEVPVGAFFLD